MSMKAMNVQLLRHVPCEPALRHDVVPKQSKATHKMTEPQKHNYQKSAAHGDNQKSQQIGPVLSTEMNQNKRRTIARPSKAQNKQEVCAHDMLE
jgi:hypothetical protein